MCTSSVITTERRKLIVVAARVPCAKVAWAGCGGPETQQTDAEEIASATCSLQLDREWGLILSAASAIAVVHCSPPVECIWSSSLLCSSCALVGARAGLLFTDYSKSNLTVNTAWIEAAFAHSSNARQKRARRRQLKPWREEGTRLRGIVTGARWSCALWAESAPCSGGRRDDDRVAQLGGDAAGRVDNDGDGCTRRGGLAASGSGGGVPSVVARWRGSRLALGGLEKGWIGSLEEGWA